MNGQDYEREFARQLSNGKWCVIRAPASGSATERSLPDLAWGWKANSYCAELKATSENVAYYDEDEVQALLEFAAAFNSMPVLAARFKGDTTFYTCSIQSARRTDSGRYAVDRDNETLTEWTE